MKSCFNCKFLDYVKQTIRFGEEPVCVYPPNNFNEIQYRYKDIASNCDKYERKEAKAG
ncbi:hypothetical protein [Orenia marismortui]|uniref:Uncharacterized protein n=1 Tax=Orenia marismortui TaxID=46469 RepID=A0A4R8H1M4_9FIRM|nr:hypothetical protein [Orenia marismortui]TDX48303.1 hypothetical protein C7959_13030 [Orenia marismortui]